MDRVLDEWEQAPRSPENFLTVNRTAVTKLYQVPIIYNQTYRDIRER